MTSPRHILLVEDDDRDRILFEQALKREFGEMAVVECYTDFWRVTQRAKRAPDPVLVLVDVQLTTEDSGRAVVQNGRELVEALNNDDDVLADARILTGQTMHPEDLDKSNMAEVMAVVRAAMAPRKANPESNLRLIERHGRKIAYGEELTRREIDIAKQERKSLHDDVGALTVAVQANTDGMGELTEAYKNRKPTIHPVAQTGIVAFAIISVIAVTIMFLGRNMDVNRLESEYKNWRIGVNSEVDEVRSAVDVLEYELDTSRSSDMESDGGTDLGD